jgi:hypothetical protein
MFLLGRSVGRWCVKESFTLYDCTGGWNGRENGDRTTAKKWVTEIGIARRNFQEANT